jgi:putative aldouronate transport system permease protein
MQNKKGRLLIRYNLGDRVFLTLNMVGLGLILILILYPLLYVVTSSLSGGEIIGGISLIPTKWTLEGYRAIFDYKSVWTGYRNSFIYLVVGTSMSMVVTVLAAYPLSRKDLFGRNFFMTVCVFTMYFNGGLVPTFLLVKDLGLLDSMWAVVLPVSLSVFNMIVMRTYFQTQIPTEMLEASQIDGCGTWRFLMEIVLPLSGPILAVIALYYAVAQWNSYFWAMIYISSTDKLPLPNILREIFFISMYQTLESSMSSENMALIERRTEIMKYSLIVVASLPMMMLYPFVQKYFVKGVMIGAVKG